MSLVTTKEMFEKAYNGGYAIGAFNVNNMEIVQGITEAAGELKSPVILQVSKGARAYANHTYLVKLVEAAEKYKEAISDGDIYTIIHADEAFHKIVVNFSNNKTLIEMVSQIQELALRFRYIFYEDFARFQGQPKEHQEIVEAILAGDGELAKVLASAHISHLKEFVEKGDF